MHRPARREIHRERRGKRCPFRKTQGTRVRVGGTKNFAAKGLKAICSIWKKPAKYLCGLCVLRGESLTIV